MSLLLLLAQASGAELTLPQRFGLEPKYVVFQTISFLILFAVLYRFGIKPVIGKMEERKQAIDAGLKYAEEMKAKLDAAQQATQAQIREAQQKAQQIVADAQKAAKELAEKLQQEAVEKSNGILVKAQEAIELEKKKMFAEARTEIARLVVATTQRVLAQELSEADRARYNESAARELTSV